jgi:glycosyltransferase involved in cell wall biosynthesis
MIGMRWPLPGLETLVHRWFCWFHRPARHVLAPTPSMALVLQAQGFENVVTWTRGVDCDLFRPRPKTAFADRVRPIALYAGRVAIEKGLPDFLDLELPGSKVVVGDGPMLAALKASYPAVHFTGYLEGERLADAMAAADVFVFPSRTDTFGLVMIEALASGVPVAAYDVPGPRDIIAAGEVGMIGDDLRASIMRALDCSPARCRAHAMTFSWDRAAGQFESYLVPLDSAQRERLHRPATRRQRRCGAVSPVLARPKQRTSS